MKTAHKHPVIAAPEPQSLTTQHIPFLARATKHHPVIAAPEPQSLTTQRIHLPSTPHILAHPKNRLLKHSLGRWVSSTLLGCFSAAWPGVLAVATGVALRQRYTPKLVCCMQEATLEGLTQVVGAAKAQIVYDHYHKTTP